MEIFYGGIAGMVTGVVGAFVSGIFQITWKRLRNRRLIRRDEPPIRDALFDPWWVLFGLGGLVAGLGWTFRLDGTWVTGAIAGCALPAIAIVAYTIMCFATLRR